MLSVQTLQALLDRNDVVIIRTHSVFTHIENSIDAFVEVKVVLRAESRDGQNCGAKAHCSNHFVFQVASMQSAAPDPKYCVASSHKRALALSHDSTTHAHSDTRRGLPLPNPSAAPSLQAITKKRWA